MEQAQHYAYEISDELHLVEDDISGLTLRKYSRVDVLKQHVGITEFHVPTVIQRQLYDAVRADTRIHKMIMEQAEQEEGLTTSTTPGDNLD